LEVDPREEVKVDRIRHCRGGGRLWRNLFRLLKRGETSGATLPPGKQRPPREEVRRAPFGWPTLGRRWRLGLFVIAGEEVGSDEISFAIW